MRAVSEESRKQVGIRGYIKEKRMKKKLTAWIVLATVLSSALAGCGFLKEDDPEPAPEPAASEASVPEEVPEETPTPEPEEEKPVVTPESVSPEEVPEGMVKSLLTGEYVDEAIGKRRPVAFMIDNVAGAFPHYGFRSGGVYYEAPVEGNLTRELLITENYDDLNRIGSLRSCRDYYISYAFNFDAIYCHYGQAAYALPYLETDEVDNISGLASYGGNFFYRSADLAAPHNAQTSGASINDAIEYLGYEKNHPEDVETSFRFLKVGEKADMTGGTDAAYVETGYLHSQSWFEYDPSDGLYYRFQYGDREMDGTTNEQIRIKNVILEFEDASWYDESPYQHLVTTGEGRGKYITDGKAIDITWKREDFYKPVHYYLMDGTELQMNTGKTWVSIIKNQEVGACLAGASKQDAKCVVDPQEQAELERRGEAFSANFKANEVAYRDQLNRLLNELYLKHGGKSKASPLYDQDFGE